jgi:NADH:ubiquinone oxidoreductase subunit 6 (subunit J)
MTDPDALRPLGPIALAAGLGMAAVYVLLPRPRPLPRLLGAALGAAALVAAAVCFTRAAGPRVEQVLFYAFSAVAVGAAGVMVTQHNAARAALAFALAVLSTTGLFLLSAAPFLMAGAIIIYAGAVIVTFLFVLMLAQPEGHSDADLRSREPLLAAVAGFFLLTTLVFVLHRTYDTTELDAVLARVDAARAELTPEGVRQALGDPGAFEDRVTRVVEQAAGRPAAHRPLQEAHDGLMEALPQNDIALLHRRLDRLREAGEQARRLAGRLQPGEPTKLSPFAGAPANQPPQPVSAENVAGLGTALFIDYLLAVELGGTLLLVATIGAIAIAHRSPGRRPAVR